ncbi:hypothetical protein [Rhizobium sp. RAF56]|uniref:hypothetical protein n=1 Tax=Rhizobium sp. RAF56 TaxID=3233062 RepID=UPI003F9AE46A
MENSEVNTHAYVYVRDYLLPDVLVRPENYSYVSIYAENVRTGERQIMTVKKPMGRPPHSGERRDNIVKILLTDEEMQALLEAAKPTGIPAAIWVRFQILQQLQLNATTA